MGCKGACLILHHEMLIRCLYVVCLLHCKAIDKTKQNKSLGIFKILQLSVEQQTQGTTATTKEDSEERKNTFLALTLLLRRF